MKTHLPYPKLIPTGTTRHGRTEFELLDDFTIVVPVGRGTHTFTFPRGLITDFGSVPRPLWLVISPLDPRLLVAFLVHDDLYGEGGFMSMTLGSGEFVKTVNNQGVSRFFADSWLRILAELYQASLWKRVVVFYMVRLFGWWVFQRVRREMRRQRDESAV